MSSNTKLELSYQISICYNYKVTACSWGILTELKSWTLFLHDLINSIMVNPEHIIRCKFREINLQWVHMMLVISRSYLVGGRLYNSPHPTSLLDALPAFLLQLNLWDPRSLADWSKRGALPTSCLLSPPCFVSQWYAAHSKYKWSVLYGTLTFNQELTNWNLCHVSKSHISEKWIKQKFKAQQWLQST